MNVRNEDKDDDFSFEIEAEDAGDAQSKPEIEIEDDTPPEDRNREPMPKELVEELEADELGEYSEKVKTRLKQMKKVWHDERREKEREQREKNEALTAAQRLLEENRKLKTTLAQGEESLLGSYKQNVEGEVLVAKRAFKEAYEAGDADALAEAQEKLNTATYRMEQLKSYRPTLQGVENEVQVQHTQVQSPRLDQKTMAWQERNNWYGTDPEMTATALGLHQKLITERGPQFAGTDEYWGVVDKTMRRRFSDYFWEGNDNGDTNPAAREPKASSVVAPASRTRSPKKVVLKQTQLDIARKLGLTPEQYAREFIKLEK